MKSVPSVASLACGLAATCRMVDSFAPTTTSSSPIIQRPHTMRSEPATTSTTQLFDDDDDARATFTTSTSLRMGYGRYGDGRSSPRNVQRDRTKRQERVGHVVRTELATILHRGTSIKGDDDPIEQELRRRINLVHTDVSPDLRHARITVSIMAVGKKGGGGGGGGGIGSRGADTVARRRAYAWLVRNTKAIRHSLAQRMKHMKASPDLTFVQVDVGAAVDVMHLIERVASEGYKRDDVLEMDFEEEWDEEDGDGGDDDGWFDFDEEGDGISVEVEA